MGVEILEYERSPVDDGGAVERVGGTGRRVAEMDVTVGQFDGEARGNLVGKSGVSRPGEIPFRRRVAEGRAQDCSADLRGPDVDEIADRVARGADAGAD